MNTLQRFTDQLPWREYWRIRGEVIAAAGITPQTWRNWHEHGVRKKVYKRVINDVLAANGYGKLYDGV